MVNINIWGRVFALKVEYDCYSGENVTPSQKKAIERFLGNPLWIEKAKKTVEIFCKNQVESDNKNSQKDDIFSYIRPHFIFVKRDKESPRVALMCQYRYDPEHGLAVVFDSHGKATVGIQDIIL